MGALCCCFAVPDIDDHGGGNESNCLCFNSCIQNMMNKYAAIFGSGRGLALPPSNHGSATSDPVLLQNDSPVTSGQYFLNNSDTRFSPVQQEVVVRRQGKGPSHSRVEPEPLRDTDVQEMPKVLGVEDILKSPFQKESTQCHSESCMKVWQSKLEAEEGYEVLSSEDEDVCPTCLDEYTPENPKIVAQCLHHYHLSCIYEWKERSESCPVCGKLMVFEETL